MDKWQAIQEFWESFGLNAYDENTVPEDAQLPYITYQAVTGEFEQNVALSGDIWYRSQSWAAISQKADQISQSLGIIRISPHKYLYLSRGMPFAQRMSDPDTTIRRIHIELDAEFFTDF